MKAHKTVLWYIFLIFFWGVGNGHAHNTLFLKGDAFFYGVLSKKSWSQQKEKPTLLLPYGHDPTHLMLCGSSGVKYLKLAQTKAFRRFLQSGFAAARKERPSIFHEKAEKRLHLLFVHREFSPRKHMFFQRYNRSLKGFDEPKGGGDFLRDKEFSIDANTNTGKVPVLPVHHTPLVEEYFQNRKRVQNKLPLRLKEANKLDWKKLRFSQDMSLHRMHHQLVRLKKRFHVQLKPTSPWKVFLLKRTRTKFDWQTIKEMVASRKKKKKVQTMPTFPFFRNYAKGTPGYTFLEWNQGKVRYWDGISRQKTSLPVNHKHKMPGYLWPDISFFFNLALLGGLFVLVSVFLRRKGKFHRS